MRVNKNMLKSVVKECLVEILSEGIQVSNITETRARKPKPTSSKTKKENPNFHNTIKNTVSNMTSDPILAQIFTDTAKTTLQEQYNKEIPQSPNISETGGIDGIPPSPGSHLDTGADPQDLPGAQNWAKLAFDE